MEENKEVVEETVENEEVKDAADDMGGYVDQDINDEEYMASIKERVDLALDEIRNILAMDGGGIELEEFGRGEIGRQRDWLESEGLGEEAEEEVELMLRCRRRVKQVF